MDNLHLSGRIINLLHTTRPYMSTDIAVDSGNGETTVFRAVKEDSTGKKKKKDSRAQLGQVINTWIQRKIAGTQDVEERQGVHACAHLLQGS